MNAFLTGTNLQILLIAQYAGIALVFAYEGNWPKAAYFVSAGLITTSVIFMY